MDSDFKHPDDGWYHIEAKGRFPNARAKAIQIIDGKACQSIVANFNKEASAPGFPGMLIDIEHFKHDDEKETRAYGWATRLQNRPDGIFAQIRWTGVGSDAVDNGDYRFFSTEYDLRDIENIGDECGKKLFRPLRLDGLTLTNTPNNARGQKPITNKADPELLNREHSLKAKAALLSQVASEATGAAKKRSRTDESADDHEAAAEAHFNAADAHEALGYLSHSDVNAHIKQAVLHDASARRLRGESANANNRESDTEADTENMNNDPNPSADARTASDEANKLSDAADSPAQHEAAAIAHRKAAKAWKTAQGNGSQSAAYHEGQAGQHDDLAARIRGAADDEDDGCISPEQAALCNRLVLEHAKAAGLSYSDARMNILRERPELFRPVRVEIPDTPATRRVAQEMAANARLANRRQVQIEIDQDTLDEQKDAIADCQREEGVSYIEARDRVRNRRPDLFGIRYEQRSVSPSTLETAGEASEREAAVQEYRTTNRCTYEEAHNAVRNRRPALFGLRSRQDEDSERITNRAPARVASSTFNTSAGGAGRRQVWGKNYFPRR